MNQVNAFEQKVPSDYRVDHMGRLVHESAMREVDKLRDDLVKDLVNRATLIGGALKDFKIKAMQDIEAFADLSAQRYNVKLGGKKGNITLMSFDGKYKILRTIAEYIRFNEGLNTAYELIEKCFNRMTVENADPNVRTIIDFAFMRDKNNNLKTHRVMGLLQLDFVDKDGNPYEEWITAKKAITESIMVTGSKSYIRIYKRDDTSGEYRPINLDMAAV